MPRPKVPAHQRQRAVEACNLCREAKKRCSGSAPCTQCLRRGLEQQCFITYAPRGSRARARAEASVRAVSDAASWTRDDPSPMRRASTHAVQQSDTDTVEVFQPLSPSDSRQEDGEGSQSGQTDASSTNPPRMLLNSRGERGTSRVSPESSIFTKVNSIHWRRCVDIIPPDCTRLGVATDRPLSLFTQRKERQNARGRISSIRTRAGDQPHGFGWRAKATLFEIILRCCKIIHVVCPASPTNKPRPKP